MVESFEGNDDFFDIDISVLLSVELSKEFLTAGDRKYLSVLQTRTSTLTSCTNFISPIVLSHSLTTKILSHRPAFLIAEITAFAG